MSNISFGSVCSGIEAASVAWSPLGWKAAWFSEIEPFPCAVLKHHYPTVENYGDMTKLADLVHIGVAQAPDVLCGGTPCQAFSIAGARESLDDPRGQLSLEFCEIADAIDLKRKENGRAPTTVVWENVPGVLSTKDNAFGCFIAKLAGAKEPYKVPSNKWGRSGYVQGKQRAVAWRVLDAQHFGVPQRRRRVFVIASAIEGGLDPREVLFECESVQGDLGEVATLSKNASTFTQKGNRASDKQVETTLYDMSHKSDVFREYNNICPTIQRCWGTGGGNVPLTLNKMFSVFPGVRTFECETCAPTLTAHCGKDVDITIVGIKQNDYVVRKLTPVECERLQGFPDDYTRIPYRGKSMDKCPDTNRYKALGNSWAVPVITWLGKRIEKVKKELDL